MRRFARSKPSFQEVFSWVLAVLIALLLGAFLLAANVRVAQGLGGGGSILQPWRAWRSILSGGEPYSAATARYVQQQVYGRAVEVGETPYYLDLPFHLLLLYFPFGLFQDETLVRGIYLFLSEAGLLAMAVFGLHLADWRPRRLFNFLFYGFIGLSLYTLLALREGTPAILLGLTYMSLLLALREDLEELAGALLACTFAYWEIGGPFILLVLVRIIYKRQSRVLTSFLVVSSLLAVISFLVYPGWIFPYIVGVFANWTTDFGVTPGEVLLRWQPETGARLGWGLTGLGVLILAYEWTSARGADFRSFYWTACLTISLTPLLGLRSATESLVVLLPATTLVFATVRERWKAGYWLTVSLLAAFLAVPWILFLGDFAPAPLQQDLAFISLPVVTVISLYWIRWWVLRPPRTWTERVSHPEYR